MNEPELTTGTVVRLKSGGPKMTACGSPNTEGLINVRWMNKDDTMEVVDLPFEALRIVPHDEP